MTETAATTVLDDRDAAVHEVLRGVMDTWAAGDADGFADLFAEDGTLVGDAYMRDRAEIRSFMAVGFAGPYRGTRLRVEPLTVRSLSADVRWLVTRGGVLVGEETEAPPERQFLATCLLVRRGPGWAIAAYQNAKGHAA